MAKIKQAQIDEKYVWIGGGILVVILVIFVFGRMSAKKDNQDPSDANPNVNPITVSTGNGSMEWNPSALIKEVHTAFKVNWQSGRCDVLWKLTELQDVQLIAVADGYHKTYGTTLRKVIQDAWFACWGSPDEAVFDRLDILQIP